MNGVTSVVGNRDTSAWLAKTFHSTKEKKSLLFLFSFFFVFLFLGGEDGRGLLCTMNPFEDCTFILAALS